MKIRGKKEDVEVEEKVDKEDPTSPRLRGTKKKVEVEGSRWAAFILLIFTLLFGLWFYIQGTGGWKSLVSGLQSVFTGFGGKSTYVIEN